MEVRFNIDTDFMDNLKKDLKVKNSTDVAKEAMSLLKWAVDERKQRRVILSSKSDGSGISRLLTPGLSRVNEE